MIDNLCKTGLQIIDLWSGSSIHFFCYLWMVLSFVLRWLCLHFLYVLLGLIFFMWVQFIFGWCLCLDVDELRY